MIRVNTKIAEPTLALLFISEVVTKSYSDDGLCIVTWTAHYPQINNRLFLDRRTLNNDIERKRVRNFRAATFYLNSNNVQNIPQPASIVLSIFLFFFVWRDCIVQCLRNSNGYYETSFFSMLFQFCL